MLMTVSLGEQPDEKTARMRRENKKITERDLIHVNPNMRDLEKGLSKRLRRGGLYDLWGMYAKSARFENLSRLIKGFT